ncbi:hypothetical protein PH7735_00291 [Shimia thalassica]|uniref:Uncharacterized protein n=1 Tax=Shimia thalassica TaxID=1715693 RepID=A0A0P1I0R2_9RHOB|nr:hypothetical protein PH7735_00291 [Shimia thalassica]
MPEDCEREIRKLSSANITAIQFSSAPNFNGNPKNLYSGQAADLRLTGRASWRRFSPNGHDIQKEWPIFESKAAQKNLFVRYGGNHLKDPGLYLSDLNLRVQI